MPQPRDERLHRTLSLLASYGWVVPSLMLVSLPVAGGPRPMFWLSVLLGLFMVFSVRRRVPRASVVSLLCVWGALVLPVVCSWPGSHDPAGTAKVLAVLACAILAGLFWVYALAGCEARRMLDRVLVLLIVVWCIDGAFQALFGFDLLGIPLTEDGRVPGPFAGNLRFPVLLSILLPSAVCLLALQGRQKISLLLWMVGATVTLLGGTRAQSITLIVGAGLLLPVFSASARRMLVVAVGLVLAVWLAIRLESGSGLQPMESMRQMLEHRDWFAMLDAWSSNRLSSWRVAIEMGMDRFAGVGASAFTEAYPLYTIPDDPRIAFVGSGFEINHAHHVWFAMFAEMGFLGVGGLLVLAAVLVLRWRAATTSGRNAARPYAVALGAYFFPLTLHPPLYLFWIFPVIWLLVCAYVTALSKGTSGEMK